MQPAPRTARILSYIFSFFFQSLHCVKRHTRERYIYIYIYGSEEVRFRNFHVEGNDAGKNDAIALLPLREEALTLIRGRFPDRPGEGDGSIDRSRMAGSLVGTHHDEIRVEARAILAGRAERSEASSLRLFSASSRARVRLFSRDRHVPNALPTECLRFVNSSWGIVWGEEYGIISGIVGSGTMRGLITELIIITLRFFFRILDLLTGIFIILYFSK